LVGIDGDEKGFRKIQSNLYKQCSGFMQMKFRGVVALFKKFDTETTEK
jgi:hypothetical protein